MSEPTLFCATPDLFGEKDEKMNMEMWGKQPSDQFSVEYLENPMEIIEELEKIKICFTFNDEFYGPENRKRRLSHGEENLTTSEANLIQELLGSDDIEEKQEEEEEETEKIAQPKLGIYTQSERQERLDAYREKRKRRSFVSKVRYVLRKQASEGRPRVKGRFVNKVRIRHAVLNHHKRALHPTNESLPTRRKPWMTIGHG